MNDKKWNPLDEKKLEEIKSLFHATYPEVEYPGLAPRISDYWIGLLRKSWEGKAHDLKSLDLAYDPADPLSRVQQKTTVIAYADSISRKGEATLKTLDSFFRKWFPAVGGLHILPACTVVEERFNDGYFSQVERNSIHKAFGTNDFFADLMHRYFSMNDLVLGHVDIENPLFKKYLAGDDSAGNTFYVFSNDEFQKLKDAGSFNKIFRPRPFPLFTLFRRIPGSEPFRSMSHSERVEEIVKLLLIGTGIDLDSSIVNILWLFSKVLNDQMLLDEDFGIIPDFIEWLKTRGINYEAIFTRSLTQEVQHFPYIFIPEIGSRKELLELSGFPSGDASLIESAFMKYNEEIFGEEIRALTTFSHVQVDVNTTTFEGLKALAGDLVWYLEKDLNMLRLDAVNYAFKRWGTSCFGLPELDQLMKIIYLSMECISPRIIPNLEVNDSLTTILNQMTAGTAAPPMMHDFHLASLLPAVFHLRKPSMLNRIFDKIGEYDVPSDSIRFSLSESHDGKSVRGSMDMLEFGERMTLTNAVITNGGWVKYKSIPVRESSLSDLQKFCNEASLDSGALIKKVFDPEDDVLILKKGIESIPDLFNILPELNRTGLCETATFFFNRLLEGRDPYELCITTRNSLPEIDSQNLEVERFLAFHTLAFAVTGCNVKTIYFNDLLGLENDYARAEKSGELRDIKRTKSDYDELLPRLEDENSFEALMVRKLNNLIALIDSDPALHFRGNEAGMIPVPEELPVALVHNHSSMAHSLTAVNLSSDIVDVRIPLAGTELGKTGRVWDNIGGNNITVKESIISVKLEPFGRLWLSDDEIAVSS